VNADIRSLGRLIALLSLTLCASGCEIGTWFTTFGRQPKIDPWEVATMDTTRGARATPRGNPQHSVPMVGGGVPYLIVSGARMPGTVDSMSALRNPTAPNEASLINGRKYYAINCAVCHGDAGAGDGPVTKFNLPVPSLLTESARTKTDGYLYGIIRNGRGLMPTYNRIESMDRWDVVNYVRGLQGALGAAVPTGPLGVPGETGDKIPGPTLTAPTRPAPHYRGGSR
jgi:mono/diheme cytochrome c family protein